MMTILKGSKSSKLMDVHYIEISDWQIEWSLGLGQHKDSKQEHPLISDMFPYRQIAWVMLICSLRQASPHSSFLTTTVNAAFALHTHTHHMLHLTPLLIVPVTSFNVKPAATDILSHHMVAKIQRQTLNTERCATTKSRPVSDAITLGFVITLEIGSEIKLVAVACVFIW